MAVKITIVRIHAIPVPNHLDFAARFVQTYHDFPPDHPHETLIVINGGKCNSVLKCLYASIPNVAFYEHDNSGQDIGAYQAVSRSLNADAMLCLGQSVYFHRRGWMKPLAQTWEQHGEGMYGPFASHQTRPHLNTTAFMCAPARLKETALVRTHDERYQFEHGQHSFWSQIHSRGMPVRLVTWDRVWALGTWRVGNDILRRGNQSNCLMWCNHTEQYALASPQEKRRLESIADGPRKTGVFYHARLIGGSPPVLRDHTVPIMRHQMRSLKASGLYTFANEIHIGVNGDPTASEAMMKPEIFGDARVNLVLHGDDTNSEQPTLAMLQSWCLTNPNSNVCYFHLKGAMHPNDPDVDAWRKCMENAVIANWRRCMNDLNSGADTVGAHWLTKDTYEDTHKGWVQTPFWGGNFWWARASFINQLPRLRSASMITENHDVRQAEANGGYDVEKWIGTGPTPIIKDYAPHWPVKGCVKSL